MEAFLCQLQMLKGRVQRESMKNLVTSQDVSVKVSINPPCALKNVSLYQLQPKSTDHLLYFLFLYPLVLRDENLQCHMNL